MYLRRIQIKNIRCFGEERRTVDLQLAPPFAGWTVIAGRNGSGKSTLLRALALAIVGPDDFRALLDPGLGWIHDGANDGTVRIELIRDEEDRFARGMEDDAFSIEMHCYRAYREAGERREEYGVKPMHWMGVGNRSFETHGGEWPFHVQGAQGWFLAGYGPFRRLDGRTSEARRLGSSSLAVARTLTLFREDASLQDSLAWLQDIYVRVLEEEKQVAAGTLPAEHAVMTRLRDDLFRLLNDELLPGGARIVDQNFEGLWIEDSGVKTLLVNLADGYKAVLGLLLDIARHLHRCYRTLPLEQNDRGMWTIDLPGVVLIDEVETHLHPAWQQEIGFWLKQRFPRIQFIVTTHSPFVCQAVEPHSLIRLPGPGESRNAERVDEALSREIIHGTADDAFLADLFGLQHSRSESAQQALEELAELEEKLLDGTASKDEEQRFARLQSKFPGRSRTRQPRARRRSGCLA